MTMRFEPSVTTSQIIAGISARLRAEQGPLDALLAQNRQQLPTQPGPLVPGSSSDPFTRLRALIRPPVGIPVPGRAGEEPRGARLAAPAPAPAPSGRRVTFRLPNNRRVRGHIAPSAAHQDDLAALRQVVESNADRKFAAIQQNARSIDSLARSLRELAVVVAELQALNDPALLNGLLNSIEGLDLGLRQQAQVVAQQQAALEREQGSLRETVQSQARSAAISKLTASVSMMQTTAFGTQGKLLSRNNLLLAGNNLLWGFLGNAFGWLSPLASLAVAQVTIGRRTQPRFLTGVATGFKIEPLTQLGPKEEVVPRALNLQVFKSGGMVRVPLLDRIAPGLQDSFRNRTDIQATATSLAPHSDVRVSAGVQGGTLYLMVSEAPEGLSVAWRVDTGAPNG
jgi:hypothetical protein